MGTSEQEIAQLRESLQNEDFQALLSAGPESEIDIPGKEKPQMLHVLPEPGTARPSVPAACVFASCLFV